MKADSALRAALLSAAVAFAPLAHAGRSCENKEPTADAVSRSMLLAEHTAKQLDQSGAQVVALARVGQNLSQYGIRYSHFGFAYRDGTKWRVVHKLNQCGTANGSLYRHGLGEFFLDDLYEYESAVVVPSPEVQARLLSVLKMFCGMLAFNKSALRHMRALTKGVGSGAYIPKIEKQEADLYMNPRRVR